MSKLSGDKNVNFMILMKLNDKELSMVCSVNKYVNELCKDETFWFNRVLLTYKYSPEVSRDMKTYLDFDTWKEFYFWVKEKGGNDWRITEMAKSLNKKDVVDEVVAIFKKVKLPKWINKEEFHKVFKRLAFINAHPELNDEYIEEVDIDENDEIDKIEWKTYHAFADEELLKPFLYEWRKHYTPLDER